MQWRKVEKPMSTKETGGCRHSDFCTLLDDRDDDDDDGGNNDDDHHHQGM